VRPSTGAPGEADPASAGEDARIPSGAALVPVQRDRARPDARYRGGPTRYLPGPAPAQYCPVARALCRASGVPLASVTVGPYNVDCEPWRGRDAVEGLLPANLTRVLEHFDRTRTMRPFTFQVWLQPWAAGAASGIHSAQFRAAKPLGIVQHGNHEGCDFHQDDARGV
jgi:hypothetical protein